MGGIKGLTIEQRFHNKYIINNTNGCWEWNKALNLSGYGIFGTENKKTELAHRFSYKILVGDIPEKLFVCHHCDNPKCVNPKHLFLGTNKDNMQDASKKGRLTTSIHPSYAHYRKGCRCIECNSIFKEYNKAYKTSNKKELSEKNKIRRLKNIDKIKAYQKNYWANNPEYQKEYRKNKKGSL